VADRCRDMRGEASRGGSDVHGSGTLIWTGQVSPYRKGSCTLNGLSGDAPMQSNDDACPCADAGLT